MFLLWSELHGGKTSNDLKPEMRTGELVLEEALTDWTTCTVQSTNDNRTRYNSPRLEADSSRMGEI